MRSLLLELLFFLAIFILFPSSGVPWLQLTNSLTLLVGGFWMLYEWRVGIDFARAKSL